MRYSDSVAKNEDEENGDPRETNNEENQQKQRSERQNNNKETVFCKANDAHLEFLQINEEQIHFNKTAVPAVQES